MSKNHNVFLSSDAAIERYDLDLKNRGLAALLAWLVPGLGHFYQGRNVKGAIFMLCIGTLLVFGIYVGQGRGDTVAQVVHASTADFGSGGDNAPTGGRMGAIMRVAGAHWKFVCQSGVGAVALPALVQRDRARKGREPLMGGLFAPPDMSGTHTSLDSSGHTVEHPNELAKWNYDAGFAFEVGTMYTVIAGLLNLIVIYDAAYGPLATAHVVEDLDPKDSEDDKSSTT